MPNRSPSLLRRLLVRLVPLALLLAAGACEERRASSVDGALAQVQQPIYYGSREPQTVALTEGQKLAVGWLYYAGSPASPFCTGTLVAANVVVTARHCLEGVHNAQYVGFGVGLYPHQARDTFAGAAIHLHGSVDAALLILAESATAALPDIVPVPVNRVSPSNLRGQQVDGAGYGRTHDDSTGRYFAAVWLERVGASYLTVDGRGEQGMCFGDSGGPLLGPGPVVLAVESAGDDSCVGQDEMTRLDAILSWIDPIVAGGSPPDECDGLDYLGRCAGDVAEWCEGGAIQRVDCRAEGYACGYVDDRTGWYCVESGGGSGEECAGGLDYLGRCAGDVAEWCEDGQVRQVDCAAAGHVCGYVDDRTGWYCVEPGGGTGGECPDGLDLLGRCAGDVAEWCEGGQVRRFDCGAEGYACGWVDEDTGYYCVEGTTPVGCGAVTANGQCDGDVVLACVAGAVQQRDCAADGLVCRVGGDRIATCVEPGAGVDAGGGGPGGPDAGGGGGPGVPDVGGGGGAGGDDAGGISGPGTDAAGGGAGGAAGGAEGGGCRAGGPATAPWSALALLLVLAAPALAARRRAWVAARR